MLDSVKRSLGVKSSLLVAVIAFVVFTVLLVVGGVQQRSSALHELDNAVSREARLIQLAIERPMKIGDDAGTREEFSFLEQQYKDMEIHLTTFKGNITYSTRREWARKDLDAVLGIPDLKSLTDKGLKANIAESKLVERNGRDLFARVISVPNAPDCHHCHGGTQPILGAMVIMQDVTPVMSDLRWRIGQTIALSAGGLLALVAVLVVFIRRVIVQRVINITKASDKVAQGELNTQFDTSGTDELSHLASNLEGMVHSLKTELGFSKGILNGMTTPCLVCDTEGRITFTNRGAMQCFGHDGEPSTVLGMPVGAFVYGDPNRSTITLRTVQSRQSTLGGELNVANRKGEEKHILVDSAPLLDLDGNLIGAFSIYTDLTDIKKQQQLIAAQNERISKAADAARSISNNLASASAELSEQVDEANRGSEEQRHLAAESARSMEQMNAAVLDVAKSASGASDLALSTREQAREGTQVVEKAMECIGRVAAQARELSADMGELGEQAEGINRIITVIEDIADQTNLLALNAAIEAARAGEAGRGFAVVADEVRKLAEKTMDATRQVVSNIGSIQQSVRKSMGATSQAVELVEESTGLAGQSGQALNTILEMVERTADQVRAIAAAAEEQSAASDEINRSVDQISTISAHTAHNMQQSSEAVVELARLAHELDSVIEGMRSS